ncbi:DEAD/DEAH box helicase [Methanosarcina hadiensis]|uniref:DEAD/DEAH box helicase n=1 Tax=Methanosarcina hadiensis TaxID=3078083 RepID=UPI0039777D4D
MHELSFKNNILTNQIDSFLSTFNLTRKKFLLRGFLYLTPETELAVIVDHEICNRKHPFNYSEYTKEQNEIVFSCDRVFRFVVDDEIDFLEMKETLPLLISGEFCDDTTPVSKGPDRRIQCIDPTIPESYFEDAFCEVFGREVLSRISREYPMLDVNGRTRWIDYVIHTEDGFIGIEKNGESYHHPQIIGKERYMDQLLKQNSIVSQGGKVYRWSLGSMQFRDVFCEEIKRYFPEPEKIVDSHHVFAKREFELFEHQEDVLEAIESGRRCGKEAFLVHLPTGTGKTHILISDFFREYERDLSIKALVLVPSISLKKQTMDNFLKGYTNWNKQNLTVPSPLLTASTVEQALVTEKKETYSISIGDSEDCKIMVQTYAGMARRYQKFKQDHFQYIAIDEAHHSVAPTIKKVIQYFNPNTLLGLTATPERLDKKKLEEIFGEYETNLTLKEAIEKGILSPIKAFRVKSNLDLSEIRYNGKDYVISDLQKNLIVPSRDQLIVDILKKYFTSLEDDDSQEKLPFKSGLIFCVSVAHAESLARRMREQGISARAVSGKNRKSMDYIREYEDEKIQFLCTCSLITEGWDSPRTSIIVMARPTMSKALYLQQLGRGTRLFPGKEALYVIDVVDNYGPFNMPWSCHGIFGIDRYVPWANLLKDPEARYEFSPEELILTGLYEEERAIEKINIFTFEKEYPDYINTEQLARELFISTGTLKSWIQKGDVEPDVEIPFGRKTLQYFKPEKIDELREKKGLKEHDDKTIYEDFFDFLDKGDYSFSYKIIFMLSFLKCADHTGECSLDELADLYSSFYLDRREKGLSVDRPNCPFNNPEVIKDRDGVKRSILSNPFEKFERKRFMYHCKDLNRIAFSSYLWQKINNESDIRKIQNKMIEDLENYYRNLDGVPDIEEVKAKYL